MGYGKTYRTKWLEDISGDQGNAGQVLSTTSAGISWVDASTLPVSSFWTASGNDIYNSNSGNVGIGTTSPSEKLHVNGKLRLEDQIRLFKNGGDGLETSGVYIANANNSRAYNFQQNADGSSLNLWTYGGSSWANKVTIQASGNVGIGTDDPSQDLTLYRDSGDTNFLISSNNGASQIFFGDTESDNVGKIDYDHSNNSLSIITNSSESMRITNAGNVGIGTTSPGALLSVAGSYSSSDEIIEIGGGTGANTDFKLKIGAVDQDYIWFQSVKPGDNYYDLVFNPLGGNVGIGTTSPSAKLSLGFNNVGYFGMSYDSNANPYILSNAYLDGNTSKLKSTGYGADASAIRMAGDSILFNIWDGTNADETITWNTAMAIASGGNVGIGTTNPSANLDIEDASGVTVDINSSSGDGLFRFQDNGTTKWSMGRDNTQQNFVFSNSSSLGSNNVLTLAHSTGNVGIGTTSPAASALLDVASTTKGVLLPRMSTTQINAISSPAEGLTVYNTVLSTLCFFNGISWQKVTSTAM